MNICIFAPYADPERGAAIIRVNAFRDFFVQQGHSVRIIAPKRTGAADFKNIYRFGNILDLASFILKNDFDIVLGTSPPLPNNFIALLACKLKRIPFVLDGKDDAIALLDKKDSGYNSSLKHGIYMLLRRFVYKNANQILVLTKQDAELESKRYSLPINKFTLVMNGTDDTQIKKDVAERKKLCERFSLSEKEILLVYAGSFGDEEVIPFLKESSILLKKQNMHILLILTVDDSKKADVLSQINNTIADLQTKSRIHVVLNVPYAEIFTYFSAADIAIIPWPNTLVTSIPTKVFDYMAAELPIVAKGPNKCSLASLFAENPNIGFYSGDWPEFNKDIEKLVKSAELRKKIGISNRKLVIEKYLRKKSAVTALNVLESVARKIR